LNKIRVYSLARELKLENSRVIELAHSLGVDVATPSSTLDGPIANRIRELQAAAKPRSVPHRPVQQLRPTAKTEPQVQAPAAITREPEAPAAAPAVAVAAAPAPAPAPPAKRYYLVDGLNVLNWQKTPSLAPLLTLLIELKRQGHAFLCIFDANTRFVLEELGERDKYEQLIQKYDCLGEVPGGTRADDFLLFRAHKMGEAIISNDQYREPKYRDRYKWLRSVSPRLCKGIVLGGFLSLPELDVHARVRDNLTLIIKEFEDLFGRPPTRQRISEHRPAPKTEPPSEPKVVEATEQTAEPGAEQRAQRSRRGRRRRGRRGGGGGAAGGAANGPGTGTGVGPGNGGGGPGNEG